MFFCPHALKRGRMHFVCKTVSSIDFFQDQVLKSGSLNKKAQRTKRWIKHWFVLKNDALSWYQSSVVSFFCLLLFLINNTTTFRILTFHTGFMTSDTRFHVIHMGRKASDYGPTRRRLRYLRIRFPAARSG